jgi:hypothetical protein
MSSHSSFLDQLEQEAHKQSQLARTRLLPRQLDWLTSLVGTYPWQTVLVSSGVTAAISFFSKGWSW